MFGVGGMGLVGLMGWGLKNLLRVFDRTVRNDNDNANKDDDDADLPKTLDEE